MNNVKIVLDPIWDFREWKQFAKGSEYAAAYDIRSSETWIMGPGDTAKVATGLRLDMPKNIYLEVFSRSGTALGGLALANGVGVIDSDYKGELFILLRNYSNEYKKIACGDRIAQGIFKEIKEVSLDRVSVVDYNMTKSARGQGGFGSTGIN